MRKRRKRRRRGRRDLETERQNYRSHIWRYNDRCFFKKINRRVWKPPLLVKLLKIKGKRKIWNNNRFYLILKEERKGKKREHKAGWSIKKTEREIKETIPFTVAMKRIKYLGINLPKETKDLYIENYETLIKEIKDDTNKWRHIPVHGSVESI